MNLRRLTGRVAAAGAVGALAAGALVGIATTAAQAAAPAAVPYTCTVLGNALPILVTPTGALPSQLTADQAVAANTQNLTMDFTVPRAVLDGLAPYGVTKIGLSTSNFAYGVGATPLPVTGLSADKTAVPATGDLVLPVAGKNGAYTSPAVGTYDLTMPAAFAATVATDSGLVGTQPATCAITDPTTAKIGSVDVVAPGDPGTQYSSTTSATAPKSVKKGAAVKISVTVTADMPATGKVTAKEGSKSLRSATLKNGKATITVKGLKPGKHKIKVAYSGDSSTLASTSKAVTVTVRK